MIPPQETTITVTTSNSKGQQQDLIKSFRFIHLVLNVVCVTIASTDWYYLQMLMNEFRDSPEVASAFGFNLVQKNSRIFYLVVTVTLMIASLALLVFFSIKPNLHKSDVLSPKLEVIYYVTGFVLLYIASLVILERLVALGEKFYLHPYSRMKASFSFINSGIYLASAILR